MEVMVVAGIAVAVVADAAVAAAVAEGVTLAAPRGEPFPVGALGNET